MYRLSPVSAWQARNCSSHPDSPAKAEGSSTPQIRSVPPGVANRVPLPSSTVIPQLRKRLFSASKQPVRTSWLPDT